MIFDRDISNAVKNRLMEAYPADMVYIDQVPADFVRPSRLVEIENFELEPENYASMTVTVLLRVTCFPPVDKARKISTKAALSAMMYQTYLALHGVDARTAGALPVADRHLHISRVTMDKGGLDYCMVDIILSYVDDRVTMGAYPYMEEVDLSLGAEIPGSEQF